VPELPRLRLVWRARRLQQAPRQQPLLQLDQWQQRQQRQHQHQLQQRPGQVVLLAGLHPYHLQGVPQRLPVQLPPLLQLPLGLQQVRHLLQQPHLCPWAVGPPLLLLLLLHLQRLLAPRRQHWRACCWLVQAALVVQLWEPQAGASRLLQFLPHHLSVKTHQSGRYYSHSHQTQPDEACSKPTQGHDSITAICNDVRPQDMSSGLNTSSWCTPAARLLPEAFVLLPKQARHGMTHH
jgi:hypothetical protein